MQPEREATLMTLLPVGQPPGAFHVHDRDLNMPPATDKNRISAASPPPPPTDKNGVEDRYDRDT
jgi:hypothetical protein